MKLQGRHEGSAMLALLIMAAEACCCRLCLVDAHAQMQYMVISAIMAT